MAIDPVKSETDPDERSRMVRSRVVNTVGAVCTGTVLLVVVITKFLAGAWIALVDGFGGMRAGGGRIRFAPRLPSGITRLGFRLRYRGRRLRVMVTRGTTSYHLLDGPPLPLAHHGEEFVLDEHPATRQNPPPPAPIPRIRQPPGREPIPRRPQIC